MRTKLTPSAASASSVGVRTQAEMGECGSTTRPSIESDIRKSKLGRLVITVGQER